MCKDFMCVHSAFVFSEDSDDSVLTCQYHHIMIYNTKICKQCDQASCSSCYEGGGCVERAGKGNVDGLHSQTAF